MDIKLLNWVNKDFISCLLLELEKALVSDQTLEFFVMRKSDVKYLEIFKINLQFYKICSELPENYISF